MEIFEQHMRDPIKLKVALFDFDGTLSTLRYGWESIMEPMMLEMISGPFPADPELLAIVREYIDQSTGIQTIFQMQWLADMVKKLGRNPDLSDDPWWFKAEYLRRLREPVNKRIRSIQSGQKIPEDYLISGSRTFLEALSCSGMSLYVASGTDHAAVVREVDLLGLKHFFSEIVGAPQGKMDCSKESLLRKLISERHLEGSEIVVIGDGKVEIALGREVGALTLGVASDEAELSGMNPVKRGRLIQAKAHAIVGDFGQLDQITSWLGISTV
jgi:phosphoglycolate phosphatase-like HAD superfamily hydrolase